MRCVSGPYRSGAPGATDDSVRFDGLERMSTAFTGFPACRLDLAAAPRVRSNFLSQVIGTRRVATASTLSMLVQGFGAMIRRSGYRFIADGADRHKRWAGNRRVPGPAQ